jgi:hypothetical protein
MTLTHAPVCVQQQADVNLSIETLLYYFILAFFSKSAYHYKMSGDLLSRRHSTIFLESLRNTLFTPLLAPLMEHRLETAVVLGAGLVQISLAMAGLPGWACPIKSATGIPSPGCVLTAATELLLRCQWRASIHAHCSLRLWDSILAADFCRKLYRMIAGVGDRTCTIGGLDFESDLYSLRLIL